MTRYVVRSTSGVLVPLLANLSFLAVFAVVVGVVQQRWSFVVVAAVLAVAFTVPAVRSGRNRLVVDADGVLLAFPDVGRAGGVSRRRSSWASILRLEVDPTTDVLRVVLRADAPRPVWLRGRSVGPSAPGDGPAYEHAVPGLDPAAFGQAVRGLSPRTRVVIRS